MVSNLSKLEEINVLTSRANWAWPQAMRSIFQPRGVNLMVAESPREFVDVVRTKRIHTTIVDTDYATADAMATLRVLRIDFPRLPCILLSSDPAQHLLRTALQLNAFSVVEKPVDMNILRQLLDRLFIKQYDSDIFAENIR